MPHGDGLTYEERFWTYVDKTNGPIALIRGKHSRCWMWTGCGSSKGSVYGSFYVSGKMWKAHRFSYFLKHGKLPDAGLELDHLCRNQRCVRPSHCEPVTHFENNARSPVSITSRNLSKTTCPKGHPYNTVKKGTWPGRRCLECDRDRHAARLLANPEHIRNLQREHIARKKARSVPKTECGNGHPLSSETVTIDKRGRRLCNVCLEKHRQERRAWMIANNPKKKRQQGA